MQISAQVNSILAQVSNSNFESFAGGMSGDGRFIVFESRGDIATINPRNSDNNREIFLFDYAQRQIFQLTNTVPVRISTDSGFVGSNIRVEIANVRPVISTDGRWIAFGSNATANSTVVDGNVNPGKFNGEVYNPSGGSAGNPLTTDANLEIWLYQIPAYPQYDLTTAEDFATTDLSGGTFRRVTDTLRSLSPRPASDTAAAFVADDNRDVSINRDGSMITFSSNRNIDGLNDTRANDGSDEIFVAYRDGDAITKRRLTLTDFGSIQAPNYASAPNISASGGRVAFVTNANNPIVGSNITTNSDRNEEIFIVDLETGTTSSGTPIPNSGRQITNTVRSNPADVINVWNLGRRMSRDGNYIAFDSFANLEAASPAVQTSFATYLCNISNPNAAFTFERIGPRSDADTAAAFGDVPRFPGFTDYIVGDAPQTLVFTTRMNITTVGNVPATASDGLNPTDGRPTQIYATNLPQSGSSRTFNRLTKFPAAAGILPASVQPITSNTNQRMAFNQSLTEQGTGNPDFLTEVFYLLQKREVVQSAAQFTFLTGATRQTVSPSPVPTPTASPSPTPQTPAAVQGVSPGMLAVIRYNDNLSFPVTPRAPIGSLLRSFTAPIEVSGLTVTINGVAAGIREVTSTELTIVIPPGLPSTATGGNVYPVVINNNGTVIKGNVTVVPARPDIFTDPPNVIPNYPLPGLRARAFNITRTVITREPFTITTFKPHSGSAVPSEYGSKRVQTLLRLFVTGVAGPVGTNSTMELRFGSTVISTSLTPVLFAPGVYIYDFYLPVAARGIGDQPVILSITVNGIKYESRLEDTAPRLSIL